MQQHPTPTVPDPSAGQTRVLTRFLRRLDTLPHVIERATSRGTFACI